MVVGENCRVFGVDRVREAFEFCMCFVSRACVGTSDEIWLACVFA